MKFERQLKPSPTCGISPRKLAAAIRRFNREQESVALFPSLARFSSLPEMLSQEAASSFLYWQRLRLHDAAVWRRARRKLASLPPDVRWSVLSYWQGSAWLPRRASYLADLVHTAARKWSVGVPLLT